MTQREADLEARKRWGLNGFADAKDANCIVGIRERTHGGPGDPIYQETVYGRGLTWDDALNDAIYNGH